MSRMFEGCKNLKKLDLSYNFSTKQVNDMNNMFLNCELLNDIDISKFDTQNVSNYELYV